MTSTEIRTTARSEDTVNSASDIEIDLPNGDDLALSRATDFYGLDELLSDHEREIRDRVRVWCDTEVSPIAADYWESAEFPFDLVAG